MVVQREPVNVVAEVCVVVLAIIGVIESGAFGKDVIDLTLVDLTRKREAVDQRSVTQAARVRQEIPYRDLVRYLILEVNSRSISRNRIREFYLAFLIEHRGCKRCKRLSRGAGIKKRIAVGLYTGFSICHPVRANKDRLVLLNYHDRY